MARRKKILDEVSQEVVQALARRVVEELRGYPSQEKLGEWLGVSQPVISKLRGTVRERDPKPYRSLSRKQAAQIADRFDTSLEKLEAAGTQSALGPTTTDMIANRGQALDFLAGPEYPPDLIAALRNHVVPPGARGWSRAHWVEHLVVLKKAWENGSIELQGAKRRKP